MDKNEVLKHYLIAALWSSTDDNDEPFDRNYCIDDVAEDSIKAAKEDIENFIDLCSEENLLDGITDEMIGYDFWLTRCGHGAGFWDRGLGDVGNKLSDNAQSFGDAYLYTGDDGKVYIEG